MATTRRLHSTTAIVMNVSRLADVALIAGSLS